MVGEGVKEMDKAVIILSGGLDSTTCMGIAQDKGYALYPLTFQYGQKHSREVEQAKKIADYYGVKEHRLVNLDFLEQIGGSSLTSSTLEIPTREEQEVTEQDRDEIPNTYVPARNLIFLSLATAYAEVIGAKVIYIGISAVDFSGYPDCRPEFLESMNHTVREATKAGIKGESIRIEAPLMHLSKAETIRLGMKLGVPYHLTTSCYQGEQEACGVCDSCLLRLKGFQEAGFTDPIAYRSTDS